MSNRQLIINQLTVIINLASQARILTEWFSGTLIPEWPAEKSSTIHQLTRPNRKLAGRIYRQSSDMKPESTDGTGRIDR